MKLLAIDTVTEYCSVALFLDGELLFNEELAQQSHTEMVLPMVKALLAEAQLSLSQLDAIAFDRGPGSFTGLRIGAGITQGLALGANLPVIPVSSLQTLAQGCYMQHGHNQVFACIDARQGEVYWGCFTLRAELMHTTTDESISPPGKVVVPGAEAVFGAGSGFRAYEMELTNLSNVKLSGVDRDIYPLARYMLPAAIEAWEKGEQVDVMAALPLYLRDKVASPPTR